MKIKYRRYYIYYTAKFFLSLARFVPRKIALWVAGFAGGVGFLLVGKYRRIAVDNLDEVFPGNHAKNTRIAKDVFRNIAKTGLDWVKLVSMDKESVKGLVTETSGLEHLKKASEAGKGVIILASHFGNWELITFYINLIGFKGGIVGRRIYFYKYDNFMRKLRARFGAEVFYRDDSPKKMFALLKRGEVLGLGADQDIDSVEGVFVDFFGKPAYTPTGPVKLAMVTGATILPSFMIRKPDNSYKFVVEEPIIVTASEDKEEAVKRCTQTWTNVLEKYVRQHPEQWAWMHKRWKTQETKTGQKVQ
ncbi:MAG: lysophospholipid acyltransferase family protein [Candidatus Omnitrophica bacterium]|nr:lysophospholipid acyltransferase family protein [Candidatus Omnitrophota bacterium]